MEEEKLNSPPTGHKNWEEELRDEILAEEKFPVEKKITCPYYGKSEAQKNFRKNLSDEQEN